MCLGVLGSAQVLVPGLQRGEWWREWRGELWHVRESGRDSGWWEGERLAWGFCLGAFEDALWLRRQGHPRRVPLATTSGSAMQCVAFLAALVVVAGGIGMMSPGVRRVMEGPRYRDVKSLVLIQDARSLDDFTPTITLGQYHLWARRRQVVFDQLAFFRVTRETMAGGPRSAVIARGSATLFEMLGLPIGDPDGGPRLILSREMWRMRFHGDERILGQVVEVGSTRAVVAGVAPDGFWRLPGHVDGWVLERDSKLGPGSVGFVLGHLKTADKANSGGGRWHLEAPTPDGPPGDFLCVPLSERLRGPGGLILFAIILACLALPATTSLPLGEYKVSSRSVSWPTRLRRWSFLVAKIGLLLPLVYFVALDLAYIRTGLDPVRSEYIELVVAFSICLFGLRWVLRDQRQRCPVCLGRLTHPARVGQPSRSFLAWNGTELICIGGHGLLHVPEVPTSWFDTQRWLYLDPSWEFLFAEPGWASSYF
jgi:hypothetical protein